MNLSLAPFKQQSMTMFVEGETTDTGPAQLQQVVQNTYEWNDRRYKAEAREHLQGLCIARELGLWKQAELYEHKIKELVTRDVVKRVAADMPNHNTYSGFVHLLPESLAGYLSRDRFSQSLTLPGERSGSTWQFNRVETYNKLIPPVALNVLAGLSQLGLTLDDFWVAEKSRSVDPILFAQFGRTFVALAVWE